MYAWATSHGSCRRRKRRVLRRHQYSSASRPRCAPRRAAVAGGRRAATAVEAQDAQRRIRERGEQRARRVRRPVVDHQHLVHRSEIEQAVQVVAQRLAAVVRREHDREAHAALAATRSQIACVSAAGIETVG
jgi:hypothetical protein